MNLKGSTQNFREYVIRQLIILGDEKSHFLDNHTPNQGHERNQLDRLLTTYIDAVETLLTQPDDRLSSVVLIGCHISITYIEDNDSEQFTIVYPDESDPSNARISFISPLASQLLLKTQGAIVTIKTPAGEYLVRIDSISPLSE